jgi:Fe-S-cluster-containing hydrogenase component 2
MEKDDKQASRREFLRNIAYSAGGFLLTSAVGIAWNIEKEDRKVKVVVVDFTKCTGCRTCETVCSGYHHKQTFGTTTIPGLVNPYKGNILVHHFTPDIDVTLVCSHCKDAPCISACPVTPDLITGHKALYRDAETGCPTNDTNRCLGCRECARACRNIRTGTIRPNAETHKPEGICDQCNGNPQCVKYCPFKALEYKEVDYERAYAGMSPEEIGKRLIRQFYS